MLYTIFILLIIKKGFVSFLFSQSIIASTPKYSHNSYFRYASQKSTKRKLLKGQPYYYELDFFDYGGGYHAEMAVLVDKTKRTAGQVAGGYNEKQRVRINSVYLEEKQVRTEIEKFVLLSEFIHQVVD